MKTTRQISKSGVHEKGKDLHNPLLLTFKGLTGRIAIFGGSFDPFHNGHLEVGRAVREHHGIDYLVYMPARKNPAKQRPLSASRANRLEMIARSLLAETGMYVSPLELRRSPPSYTVDTVSVVRSEIDQKAELFFIAGIDNAEDLHTWNEIDLVFSKAKIILVGRDGKILNVEKLNKLLGREKTELLSQNLVNTNESYSSTQVRAKLSKGENITGLVPDKVKDLINNRNLYRTVGNGSPSSPIKELI
ncbi:MAG: nicotinate (nicotinamide) nucleotide adenylyltransferase [Bdellovibrionota bacterium]